ncbi:MAG: GNAT family N-acetyltransferase [Planctomycetota bacterium]|nr:GNAT family N-acetyltransferase [Planctomycetota bacterium]
MTHASSDASGATAGQRLPAPPVTVRRLLPTDSIPAITRLLHRAYAKQVAMGLAPLAGRQDDRTTAERAANSECYLALITDHPGAPERIAGVILFEEHEHVTFPPFFRRPDVAHFAQFGVDPDIQGRGVGRLLLETVERRARENDAAELACSMAEPDRELYDFYMKRGYRLIEHWQWPYTNYRSCILGKRLR